jgi:hypothetical protein
MLGVGKCSFLRIKVNTSADHRCGKTVTPEKYFKAKITQYFSLFLRDWFYNSLKKKKKTNS